MIETPGGSRIKRPRPKLDCSLTEEEDDDDGMCVYTRVLGFVMVLL
jgi:hypothetical protein